MKRKAELEEYAINHPSNKNELVNIYKVPDDRDVKSEGKTKQALVYVLQMW